MNQSENLKQTFLTLENLVKSYPEGGSRRIVLNGVSGQVQAGEIVAILGKSGSGKSTLLNLIGGIDQPDSGSVRVNGVVLSELDDRRRTLFRRANIGFIYQFFNLIPTLTIQENVSLPLELLGESPKQSKQKVSELLEMVGLENHKNKYPEQLSGGEQQRVAIARALVHDPLFILADEPTGNLDNETGAQVLDLLQHLVRNAGKSLIVVTHNQDIITLADRIYYLINGRFEVTPTSRRKNVDNRPDGYSF